MRFTTSKGERNLAELTHRLFEIKGAGAKARAKEIEAALLVANPHLTDLKHIPAGTPVIVPPISGAAPRATESRSTAATLTEQVRNQLAGLRKSLSDTTARETAELMRTQEILKDEDFKKLSKPADVKKRLKEITKGAADRLKNLKKLEASQRAGIDQIGKDLDTFIKRFF